MLRTALLALLALSLSAPAVRAEHQRPGSLLVFPVVDTRSGVSTVLTITNSRPGVGADIQVEVVFVSNCVDAATRIPLPPQDTRSLSANLTFPGAGQGYAFAYAKSNVTGRAISYNHLVGSVMTVDGTTRKFQVDAISFTSQFAEGALTDADGDRRRDLDGVEYSQAPDELVFPRFFGQTASIQSELVLVNLTGGASHTAFVNMWVWNDNREVFSAQWAFHCWSRTPLATMNGVFQNSFLMATNHASAESAFGLETGWLRIDGSASTSGSIVIPDPTIFACLIEPAAFTSAALPFALGTQTNGELLPNPNAQP